MLHTSNAPKYLVALKFSNCFFFEKTVFYLGDMTRPGQLGRDNKSFETVRKSQLPKNQTESAFFLRNCNFYRTVPISPWYVVALNIRTGMNQLFELRLNVAVLDAFHELRRRLMLPPIPSLPRQGQRYTLNTDACDYQIRCAPLYSRTETGFSSDI